MASPTNPPPPDGDDPVPPDDAKSAPRPGKRRKWPWVIAGLVVLVIVLVLLAPTIISSGPGTSWVAGRAKNYINGSVRIGDLSVGWFTPTRIGGVQVYDDKGTLVLELNHVQTQLSLWDALRGHYDLGNTLVDVNLTKLAINADHSTNYQQLLKTNAKPPAAKHAPKAPKAQSKLPDVTGNITINYRGTIENHAVPARQHVQVIQIKPSTAVVKIADINQPIFDDIKLVYQTGAKPPATVSVAGVIDAIQNNQLVDFQKDLTRLSADQKIQLAHVDLATIQPLLPRTRKPMDLGGIVNGALTLKADGKSNFAANGGIQISNFAAGGDALNGDVYKSDNVSLPVNVSATAAGPDDTVLDIQQLGVKTDQASILLTGKAQQQALVNLANNKPPRGEGNLSLAIDVTNLPALANDLRNTLRLQKVVTITEGKIFSKTDLAIAKDRITITQDPNTIVEAAGSNDGQKIKLEPITLKKLQFTAIPNGQSIPELRDIALDLSTVFGTIAGGGTTLADLSIKGENLSLAKLQQQAGQFCDFGNLKLAGVGAFDLSSKGDLTKPGGTAKANFHLDLHDLRVSGLTDGHELDEPLISANAGATLVRASSDKEFLSHLQDFALNARAGNAQSPLLSFATNVQRLAFNPVAATGVATTIQVPNLAQAQQQFGSLIPALSKLQLQQGQLSTSFAADYQDGTFTIESGQLASSFARATLGQSIIHLGGGNLSDKLVKASAEISIPDLPRVYDLVQYLAQKPSPLPSPGVPGEGENGRSLDITSGGAHVKFDIARDLSNQITTITVPAFQITKLAISRGSQKYSLPKNRSIDLKLAADVRTAGDKVDAIKVTQLGGDAGVARLDMPQPITITNLAHTPSANGAIKLSGSIQELTPLLAVIEGQPAKSYTGDYTVTQNVSTKPNDNIALKGTIAIPNLQTDAKITPQSFSINDDVIADMANHNATINDLTIAMPDTKAVGLTIKGTLDNWSKDRRLEKTTMNLSYDLAQLWPLIKPMLSPQQQEQFKDLKIAGKFERAFKISGSYPAGVPFNRAIQSLNVEGALAVALLDTQGVTINDLELPLTLQHGKLVTLYAGKPKSERAAKPAKFNEGTLDLSNIVVDLTQDPPVLSIGKNQPLVRNASINSLLGDTLGKYVNPVFANSKRAKGLLSVTVNQCQNVALSQALKSAKSGHAVITFSLSDMDIANPVGSLILGPIINAVGGSTTGEADTFQGYIKHGVVTLDHGRTAQDVTLMLLDPNAARAAAEGSQANPAPMSLSFKGEIDLASLKELLNVSVPAPLVSKFIPDRNFKKAIDDTFPSGIPVVMKGTTRDPKVDVGNILSKIAEAQARLQLERAIGGKKSGKTGGNQGNPSKDNPLQDLLNQLEKGGKK